LTEAGTAEFSLRTLVLGGIRSGKSRWAEAAIAKPLTAGQPVHYLATGPVPDADADWSDRIAEHRNRRPRRWSTIETADIATELRRSPDTPTLVDDVGGWLTAALDRRGWETGSVSVDVDDVLDAVGAFGAPLVLVSSEVGLTVVPATAAGRRFADELGAVNQRLAALCEQTVLVLAGQAVPIT
jgi:adenosylcobinamide kinase/adenosylcobinamide-phosphate guanylyltransferase